MPNGKSKINFKRIYEDLGYEYPGREGQPGGRTGIDFTSLYDRVEQKYRPPTIPEPQERRRLQPRLDLDISPAEARETIVPTARTAGEEFGRQAAARSLALQSRLVQDTALDPVYTGSIALGLPIVGPALERTEIGQTLRERIREEEARRGPLLQFETGGEVTLPRSAVLGTDVGEPQTFETPRRTVELTREQLGRGVGRIGGTIAAYKAAGAALAKTGLTKAFAAIKNPFARTLVTEGAKDLIASGTIRGTEGLIEGKELGEVLSEMPRDLAIDTAINATFFGVERIVDALRGVRTVAEASDALKAIEAPPQIKAAIQQGDERVLGQLAEQIQARRVAQGVIDEAPLPARIRPPGVTPEVGPVTREFGQELPLPDVARQAPITPDVPPVDPLRLQRGDVVTLTDAAGARPRVSPIDEALPGELPARFRRPEQVPGIEPEVARPDLDLGAAARRAEELAERPAELRRFPETVAESPQTATELSKRIKDNPAYYNPQTNEAQIQVAREVITESPSAARSMVLQGDTFASEIEPVIGRELVLDLQNRELYDDAFEIIQKMGEKYTKAGRAVQTARLWSRSTPEGMAKYIDRMVADANKTLEAGKKISLSSQDKQEIFEKMRDIQSMAEGRERDLATALVLRDYVIGKVDPSLAKKLSTLQAMAHLLNPKTIMRNVIGNTSFSIMEQLSKVWGTPVDKFLSLKTGRRTVGLPKLGREQIQEGLRRGAEAAEEIRLGVNLRGAGKFDITTPTFRDGTLATLERGLGYTLKVPDEFQKGIIESATIKEMTSLGGLQEPTAEILEQAAREARYGTFQDDSLPAVLLQRVKETLNLIPVVPGTRNVTGRTLRQSREFGLGDFVIKYTTVPGNIISRGIEYTPLGALRAISLIGDAPASAAAQRELSLAVGRALNGTSLMALGLILHNKGILTTADKDRDRDARALETGEGLGRYKMNVSALKRMIAGEDFEPQEGDTLKSYNWIQPINTALAIGGTIDSQMKKDQQPPEIALDALNSTFEEVLDLPTMFIVKSMIYESLKQESNFIDVASVPITQALPGFVPSALRQVGQAIDPVARRRVAQDPVGRAIEGFQMNLPGFREQLEPRLDPLGRPIEYEGGLASIFDPGQTTEFRPYEFTGQLQQLEDITGEVKQYPSATAPKSVKPRNQPKVELTPEQQTRYLQISGDITRRRYEEILRGVDVQALTDRRREQLIEELSKANRDARKLAKNRILTELRRGQR